MTSKWRFILLVSLIGNLTIAYVGYKAHEYRSHINFWLEKYLKVADEFSEREKHAAANEPLRSDSIVPGRIVFFGTQVINDWPLDGFFPGYETINRGVTGQRAAGFLLRFRPDVIELRPQYVVIEVSSYNFRPNTRAREIYDYVVSMAELAQFNDLKPILTTAFPPRSTYEVDEHPDYSVADTVAAYNNWLSDYAREHDLLLADWHLAVVDSTGNLRPDLSVTKVDLNQSGYQAISDAVKSVLAPALPPAAGDNR